MVVESPLVYAISLNYEDGVRLFLSDPRVNVLLCDKYKRSPLLRCIADGRLDFLRARHYCFSFVNDSR